MKRVLVRYTALFLVVNVLFQVIYPTVSYALTTGPSQPEVESFEPIGTTEMVDLFTGDFTYNIPLFELPGPSGGYPFNLFYNSGVGMDQEASWVGLGWNLNPGAIVRQMRGFPDEFNGGDDKVTIESEMKDNVSFGIGLGVDLEIFGGAGNLGLGNTFYYNNYRGVGYSVDPSISVGYGGGNKGGPSVGVGVSFKIDSQEGVGVNASISASVGDKVNGGAANMNVGIGFNSKSGFTGITMGGGLSTSKRAKKGTTLKKLKKERDAIDAAVKNGTEVPKSSEIMDTKSSLSIGGSSHLSFSGPGSFTMAPIPMDGFNADLNFKLGFAVLGAFIDGRVNGFYATQYIKNKSRDIPAYGYLNLQNATGGSNPGMMDFSREKDGPLTKASPNLPIPSLNYDIYTINAHGAGGMFRPYRNDIGVVKDPTAKSTIISTSIGVDVGPGVSPHIGINASFGLSEANNGGWIDQNEYRGHVNFKNSDDPSGLKEMTYYKTFGEPTTKSADFSSFIDNENNAARAKEKALRIKIERQQTNAVKVDFVAKNEYHLSDGSDKSNVGNKPNDKREPRNIVVNQNLSNQSFEVLNPDGKRYIYGKPLLNTYQVECGFSVQPLAIDENPWKVAVGRDRPNFNNVNWGDRSDLYYNRTTIDKDFPHSYLLTAILGDDYVDVDNNGPSQNDYGYWVKFTYDDFPVEDGVDYNWRVPFFGASYEKGSWVSPNDDKGSYMYGVKKNAYLTQVETKSHVAIFNTSKRMDARGANGQYQDEGAPLSGAFSRKLDKIQLFTKDASGNTSANPLKTINFQYSYDLCKEVQNNDGANDNSASVLPIPGQATNNNKGKLTLERVWFTTEASSRGKLSPYKFDYNKTNIDENPNYDGVGSRYDRWGSYRKDPKGKDFPYVDQSPANRSAIDRDAAVWSLKHIQLPSGGKIDIKYESDDYGYVQNKTAMQMFPIKSFSAGNTADRFINDERKVFFELEQPIAKQTAEGVNKTDAQLQTEIDPYLDNTGKIYFKLLMYLRSTEENQIIDYVSGYANVEEIKVDVQSLDAAGVNYTRGYVKLGKFQDEHPFRTASWQHLRTNASMYTGVGPYSADPNASNGKMESQIRSLASNFDQVVQLVGGFNNIAKSRGWANAVNDLSRSYIRLNSPDKIKAGGGVRVKEIAMNDKWSTSTSVAENDHTYGQVYDYSMVEDGKTISSGVAAYEPMVGADEIAVRNAKDYTENIPLVSNYNLFFEYPVNEHLYPAPVVGYRKVTAKSLATYYESVTGTNDPYNIPKDIHTTGATVHEFYTAKDFPVITEETDIDRQPYDLFVPIPLIGQITVNKMAASQGYSIELNDMHGKLKQVSYFKQDNNRNIIPDPISWVKYNYQADRIVGGTGTQSYYRLRNDVTTLINDNGNVTLSSASKVIGVDYDFVSDMREASTFSFSGGVKINLDVLIFAFVTIPAFFPWPNIMSSYIEARTASTNKVIHKAGVLQSVETFDGGAVSKQENMIYDDLTGRPVLTKTTNNFDDPIYTYSKPSHLDYEGMGPAYKNIGYTFNADFTTANQLPSGSDVDYYQIPVASTDFVVGDEFLVNANSILAAGFTTSFKATIREIINNSSIVLEIPRGTTVALLPSGLPSVNAYTFLLTRSGRRNLLANNSSSVISLANPLQNRTSSSCDGSIEVPVKTGDLICRRIDTTTPGFRAMQGALLIVNNMLSMDLDNNGIMDYYQQTLQNTPYSVPGNTNDLLKLPSTNTGIYSYSLTFRQLFENGVLPNPIRSAGASFELTYKGFSSNFDFCCYHNQYSVAGNRKLWGLPHICPYVDGPWFSDSYYLFSGADNYVYASPSLKYPDNIFSPTDKAKLLDAFDRMAIRHFDLVNGICTVDLIVSIMGIDGVIDIVRIKNIEGAFAEYYERCGISFTRPNFTVSQQPISTTKYQINSVLSSSFGTSTNACPYDYNNSESPLFFQNDYSNGSRGVWVSDQALAYVDRRSQHVDASLSPSVILRTDGTYDNMPLPDMANAILPQCSNWRVVNTMTQYTPDHYEKENKDILGIRSSALYGYNGKLNTAISNNAAYNEIGFESFEEYQSVLGANNQSSGNISLYTVTPDNSDFLMRTGVYEVISGNANLAIIDFTYSSNLEGKIVEIKGAGLTTYNNKNVNYKLPIEFAQAHPTDNSKTIIQLSNSVFKYSGFWKGQIKIPFTNDNSNQLDVSLTGTINLNTSIAHTGKNSLQVNRGSLLVEQERFKLVPGKKYVVSGWIQSTDMPGFTYRTNFPDPLNNTGIELSFEDDFGTVLSSQLIQPSGALIEKWQKVEGEVTVPTGATKTRLRLASPQFNTLFDDIRIHPSDASMKSFVYNPSTFKLVAELDNNNYASFYSYEPSGKLFTLKKETERGVQTIKESGSFTAPSINR